MKDFDVDTPVISDAVGLTIGLTPPVTLRRIRAAHEMWEISTGQLIEAKDAVADELAAHSGLTRNESMKAFTSYILHGTFDDHVF